MEMVLQLIMITLPLLLPPKAPSANYLWGLFSIFLFDFNNRDRWIIFREVADKVRLSSARRSKFLAELMRTTKKGLAKSKSNLAIRGDKDEVRVCSAGKHWHPLLSLLDNTILYPTRVVYTFFHNWSIHCRTNNWFDIFIITILHFEVGSYKLHLKKYLTL
jgi:hypothetical protein